MMEIAKKFGLNSCAARRVNTNLVGIRIRSTTGPVPVARCARKTESGENSTHDMALRSISRLAGSSNATSFITNSITASASRRNMVICQLGLSSNIIGCGSYLSGAITSSPRWRGGGRLQRLAVCKDPQQQQDIPRVMEIAKKIGLEILPPPGAK